MNPIGITTIFLLALSTSCSKSEDMINTQADTDTSISFTNKVDPNRMTLVLAAPSINDEYYSDRFNDIVDFQVNYAKAVMGKDNIVIVVDNDTRSYYEGRLPSDVIITSNVYDIWMRDFTTVNPLNPVQFTYTWASMTQGQSVEVQNSFVSFANSFGIQRNTTNLILDGGNIVDNYEGRVITTTRFLDDNGLSMSEGKQILKNLLNATQVAIVVPDDEVLAHADGMVLWADKNTLLVNDYTEYPDYRTSVLDELSEAFPEVTIVEVPVVYDDASIGGISSACGVNLNATTTFSNIYVPTFNMEHDQAALQIIRNNTTKNVVPVNASGVCAMGGSVRCLTWQLTGTNAEKIVLAARD